MRICDHALQSSVRSDELSLLCSNCFQEEIESNMDERECDECSDRPERFYCETHFQEAIRGEYSLYKQCSLCGDKSKVSLCHTHYQSAIADAKREGELLAAESLAAEIQDKSKLEFEFRVIEDK